jgi:hypothetical protein
MGKVKCNKKEKKSIVKIKKEVCKVIGIVRGEVVLS